PRELLFVGDHALPVRVIGRMGDPAAEDGIGRAVDLPPLPLGEEGRGDEGFGGHAGEIFTDPEGEEGIKKKLSMVFLPSLPRGERGRGSEGAGGEATLKGKATAGSEIGVYGDFDGALGRPRPYKL